MPQGEKDKTESMDLGMKSLQEILEKVFMAQWQVEARSQQGSMWVRSEDVFLKHSYEIVMMSVIYFKIVHIDTVI